MNEGGKIRVVRCPRCQKLLPELPDCPFYRCGGCDATLQAESHLPARTDAPAEKSDGEKVRICDNSGSFSESRTNVLNASSATDCEVNGDTVRKREALLGEMNPNCSFSGRRRNFLNVATETVLEVDGEKMKNGGFILGEVKPNGIFPEIRRNALNDTSQTGCEVNGDRIRKRELYADIKANYGENRTNFSDSGTGFDEQEASWHDQIRCRRQSKALVQNQVSANNLNSKSAEVSATNVREDGEVIASAIAPKRDGFGHFRCLSAADEGSRYVPFPNEATSSSQFHLPSENGEQSKSHRLHDPERVESLEKDRAQLLQELDELRIQLTRSFHPSDSFKEKFTAVKEAVPSQFPGSHLREAWSDECPQRHSDRSASREFYTNSRQFGHMMGKNDAGVPCFNPPMHAYSDVPRYREPFEYEMPKRDHSTFYPPPYGLYEGPACSCFHCFTKHHQMPPHVPPKVFSNHSITIAPTHHMIHHTGNSACIYDHDHSLAPWCSFELQPQVRKPSDFDHNVGVFRRFQPEGSNLVGRVQHTCRPISDGAPFIACCHCSKLLQLPENLSLMGGKQYKLRCGACSNVTSFMFNGCKFVFGSSSQADLLHNDGNDPCDVKRERIPANGCSTNVMGKPKLYNHESPTHNIQSVVDVERVSSPRFCLTNDNPTLKDTTLSLRECVKREALSSHSVSSEDEQYLDSLIADGSVSKEDISSPVVGLRLKEHFECSPFHPAVDRCDEGNTSKHSNHERIFSNKASSRQHSVKDASVATEMDISYNEHQNSSTSEDTFEPSKEDDCHKVSKGGESFLAALIRKGFKDYGQSKVTLNGHHIPDRLVRKAEKKAGRVQPGQYWYDYRAGFWGIMGYQCLGIIPPFIEEFNYPMPKNCSGGDTGVFVNGRELHQKDMELLADRGLPTTRSKHYLIEISGRVFDESSGEELENLGKLAPTVERLRHGFGLWVPTSMA